MAYVYENIIIGNKLDVGPTARIVTTTKGDIIGDNGTHSIRIPIGTNGQALVANTAAESGLVWQLLHPPM